MKNTRHATTNYRLILPFLDAVDATEDRAKRFKSSGYMPLSVEYLWYTDYKGRPIYGMMHFTTQDGDLMRDPDMTFSVDREAGTVHPMTYENSFMGLYQEVYRKRENGVLAYSPRLLADLDEFLWSWLRNLQEQGFRAK